MTTVSIVIPNWNGRPWLSGCLEALDRQDRAPDEVIVVDNGSRDGSLAYLAAEHPQVHVEALDHNTGFAHAANVGIAEASGDFVALVNTDVRLAPDWLGRTAAVLETDAEAGSVACKMLQLGREAIIYDAGDVLRRDGQCVQRGRFERDSGRFDASGEIFGACAGAALYRREAVIGVGGFDEVYFAYLEDVDLALRLGLAGWRCRYEPAVALHAGEGSSGQLSGGHRYYVQRNTLLLIAKAFPVRWLPLVAYRQLSWAWHAARRGQLAAYLEASAAVVPMLPRALGARGDLRRRARRPVEALVPPQPIRGRAAEGHPSRHAADPAP